MENDMKKLFSIIISFCLVQASCSLIPGQNSIDVSDLDVVIKNALNNSYDTGEDYINAYKMYDPNANEDFISGTHIIITELINPNCYSNTTKWYEENNEMLVNLLTNPIEDLARANAVMISMSPSDNFIHSYKNSLENVIRTHGSTPYAEGILYMLRWLQAHPNSTKRSRGGATA